MLKVQLVDASGQSVKVDKEGEIGVTVHDHPPTLEKISGIPFLADFTDSAGSNDMQTAATLSAPVIYSVNADPVMDIYIKTISVVIADASATLQKFGNVAALTNGCRILWQTSDLGEAVLRDDVKTNWDFVKWCRGNPSFGDGAGAFRASNVSGTSEGYLFVMDTVSVFGVSYGLRLRAGTNDKMCIIVRDDTTGVDEFTAEVTGRKF
jgi:hypothetical protein